MSISRGRLQHLSVAVIVTVIFAAGFAFGNHYAVVQAQSSSSVSPEAEQAFEPMWQVFNMIQNSYIDKIDISKLVDGATKGMVDALDDPYSGYMNPDVYKLLNSDLSGEFEGIGVVIRTNEDNGQIEVVGLLNGAPAQAAGIQSGDIFRSVDGKNVTGMNQTDLAALVRGPANTSVTIEVQRGEEQLTFTVNRAQIIVPNTETKILDDDMGYIKLNQFTGTARSDLDAALQAVDVNNRKGLILDLRDNPGGLLSSAIDVASAFIKSGPITTEAFSADNQHTYEATGEYADIQVPIVVLVNGSSASASELLAGALQDTHTATIVGETTLGKGTVQTWNNLSNGGGVRLTVAKWLTPDGRWIHKQGITPDITVEWENPTYDLSADDPQLQAAEQLLETHGAPEMQVALPATQEAVAQ